MNLGTASRAVALTVALALLPLSSASADDTPELDPGEVANLMEEVAPSTPLADLETDASGDLVATNPAGTEVTVSDEGEGATVALDGEADDLTITLPIAADADLSQADDTAVLDATGSVDIAVQTTDTGARIATILADDSAPTEYPYTFGDDVVPVLLADGSVDLTRNPQGAGSLVVGTVATPWATDANGAPVETRYRVDGATLVQVITPSPETAYPIVADPSVSYGWLIYVRYNKKEVAKYWTGSPIAWNVIVALACVAITGNPYIGATCGVLASAYTSSIGDTFKSAKAQGKGVQLGLMYSNLLPLTWKAM